MQGQGLTNSLRPQLAETASDRPFPDFEPMWTCPKTGLVVPKDPTRNVIYRANLLKEAADDEGLQGNLMAACAESCLFYVNTFCWTYRQKVFDLRTFTERRAIKDLARNVNEVDVPFVTYPIQDEAIEKIVGCISNGGDAVVNKSRDMGATWIIVAVFDWVWMFWPSTSLLWTSRKEDLVDKHPRVDMDTIMAKHDYIHNWMPEWMRPDIGRSHLHMENKTKSSLISGEATTENVGRGGRRTAIGMDEFAAADDGFGMLSASADTTTCRIMNSTHKGVGTAYYHVYSRTIAGDQNIVLVNLPWWDHPEKGRARELVRNEKGELRYTSPWYEYESKRRGSRREMSENVDMDPMGSGSLFFDAPVLLRHKTSHCRNPDKMFKLDFLKKWSVDDYPTLVAMDRQDAVKRADTDHGPWSYWGGFRSGRPDQTFNYTMGVDVSAGQGASNSVISVRCNETGVKVAEFVDSETPPHELARICLAACLWFGGRSPAKVIWESVGPGGIFGRELDSLGWSHVYRKGEESYYKRGSGAGPGWHPSRQNKEDLLGQYRKALARDEYINPSKRAVEECEAYVYYESGGIGPASLQTEGETTRSAHGDRVIADALTVLLDNVNKNEETDLPETPLNSFAARRELALLREEERSFDGRLERRLRSVDYAG